MRDNIIAGIVVAFLIGLFTIFRKSIAALFGNIAGKKPPATATIASPPAPATPQPAPQSNPPIDETRFLTEDQKTLWQTIQDQFDVGELITDLCVPLNLRPEDVLVGNTLKEKSLSLVNFCRRRNSVQQLRDAMQRARPSLPALPKPTRNTLTRFAGAYIERGKEAAVQQALCSDDGMAAIVGVTAPGGIGKSTLAQVVAGRVVERFERPVWQNCGELSSLDVVSALLQAFEVRITGNEDEPERLTLLLVALAGKNTLIVLDDVRQPNEALLQRFIPPAGCPVLATSRLALASSAIPPSHRIDLGAMTDEQARALLAAYLGDDPMQKEDAAVGTLLKRLKGNALAFDLAARSILRNKGMAHPVAAYLSRLDDRLPSMTGMPRGDLFAVFAESYDPLDTAMQRRFRRMAVFPPSGGTIAHLAAVWSEDETRADAALMRLQDAGLVKPVENLDERYRLHDLQDEWALKLLRDCGEEREARLAHAAFVIDLFGRHYTDDPSNAPQVLDEWDNLKAASDWAASAGDAETLARLATQSRNWQYNVFRNTGEWQSWLQRALQLGIQGTQLKANTLKAIGDVQQFRDDRDAALQSYNDALALFKAVGDKLGEANTKLAIARMNNVPDLYREAIALYTQIGDRYSLARGEYFYAVSLDETPDNRDLARKLLTDARLHWQAMDFEPGVSAVDNALAALDTPPDTDHSA